MNRPSQKQQITEEQERIINALIGATEGICCAVEQDTITATQIDCLFKVLIGKLQSSFR